MPAAFAASGPPNSGPAALFHFYEIQGSPYAKFDIPPPRRYTVCNTERGILMGWYVYMLRCGDGSLYTGYTNDIPRRMALHQSGRGAKYTRSRPPVALVYQEELPDKSAALRREAALKHLTRPQKLALITASKKSCLYDFCENQ